MIQTDVIMTSISDLSEEWKIAARRNMQNRGWAWCGDLGAHSRKFISSMFPEPGKAPTISCVTGRDADGAEVLYARIYPAHLRNSDKRFSASLAGAGRYR